MLRWCFALPYFGLSVLCVGKKRGRVIQFVSFCLDPRGVSKFLVSESFFLCLCVSFCLMRFGFSCCDWESWCEKFVTRGVCADESFCSWARSH